MQLRNESDTGPQQQEVTSGGQACNRVIASGCGLESLLSSCINAWAVTTLSGLSASELTRVTECRACTQHRNHTLARRGPIAPMVLMQQSCLNEVSRAVSARKLCQHAQLIVMRQGDIVGL